VHIEAVEVTEMMKRQAVEMHGGKVSRGRHTASPKVHRKVSRE
jgi:hypothetical protein